MVTYKLADFTDNKVNVVGFIIDPYMKEDELDKVLKAFIKKNKNTEDLYRKTMKITRRQIDKIFIGGCSHKGFYISMDRVPESQVNEMGMWLCMLRHMRQRNPEVYKYTINNEIVIDISDISKEENKFRFKLKMKLFSLIVKLKRKLR